MAITAQAVLPVLGLDLEVGGGGVEEEQVHLQVEQVGDCEEDPLLHRLGVLEQEVHGPIAVLDVELSQARDHHVAAHPLGAGQLAAWLQAAVGDQGEEDPLDVDAETALPQQASQLLGDPQPLPQRRQHMGTAQRAAALHAQLTGVIPVPRPV